MFRSGMQHPSLDALLLRRVEYAEADLILTFFTRELGKISALARGARKSQRRFGGALEPLHTLRVRIDERANSEFMMLREAQLTKPRVRLLTDLDALRAAGLALAWVGKAVPARVPEPEVWRVLEALLDGLEGLEPGRSPTTELAEAGLVLLGALGWGLDFEQCVGCGRRCGAAQTAYLSEKRGGLVCRSCGGAHQRLGAELRPRLVSAAAGTRGVLSPDDARIALELVAVVMRAHAGIE